ncbi:MAG: hypothetical protein ACI93R_001687 [Flavobacteriales bacterium]|jgi:hypothetical protein
MQFHGALQGIGLNTSSSAYVTNRWECAVARSKLYKYIVQVDFLNQLFK